MIPVPCAGITEQQQALQGHRGVYIHFLEVIVHQQHNMFHPEVLFREELLAMIHAAGTARSSAQDMRHDYSTMTANEAKKVGG